jgi:hypothetical protein
VTLIATIFVFNNFDTLIKDPDIDTNFFNLLVS